MSANVNHVADSTVAPIASATHTSNSLLTSEVKVAAARGGSNSRGEASSKTAISSLKDLKSKAPKIYNAMIEGIAMNICNQMQHAQDRLKTIMRQANQGY